jgi:transcription-repair coupling factor (superfamily II helicase)
MAIVYIHTKKNTNEVFYVGIGKSSKRPYQIQNRNQFWKNIVQKYGFDIKITHQNICWEEACSIEKYLIFFYKNIYKLTNLTEQYSINGDLIKKYGSFREAQRLTKISHISCCCNGNRKSAGGYIWKYK